VNEAKESPQREADETPIDDGARATAVEGDSIHGDKVMQDKIMRDKIVIEHLELHGAPQRPPAPLRTRVPEPRAARLVGREDELRWVRGRLKTGDVAAIAGVRGIGGIGKTELAIAVAQELEAFFEGRVIWLDCGPNDAHAIQERMAAALGVALDSDDLQIRADALALVLRGQPPTLVVLDDLRRRHLADLSCITPPRPPCALLVTSRRYDLPLPGEAVRRIDVLPPVQSQELLSSLIPEAWLVAEPDAARDITELLEHIPLALTLVARRAKRLAARRDASAQQPLAALVDELRKRRMQVLNQGEDPNRPDLSVVITFNASYEDLDAGDQARLRKLGVFARSEFELPTLQAVWEDDERAARQVLDRLVNAGLIEEIGWDTWWMHDLLREYAAERLSHVDSDEERRARLSHAVYWQRYMDSIHLLSVEDWRGLEVHRPEVEQAANWLLSDWKQAPRLATRLAIAISQRFLPYTLSNLRMWLEAGLAAAESGAQWNAVSSLQYSLGEYYHRRGDVARAEHLLRDSLASAQDLLQSAVTEDEIEAGRQGIAVTQSGLADLLYTWGEYEEAEELYQDSLRLIDSLKQSNPRWMAVIKSSLADIFHSRGDFEEAARLYEDSLQSFELVGDRRAIAITQSASADLFRAQGEYEEAKRHYRQSLEGLEAVGDRRSAALARRSLADLLVFEGKYDEAEELYQDSLQACQELGDPHSVAVIKSSIAELMRTRGAYDEAERLFRDCLGILDKMEDRRALAITKSNVADLIAVQGRHEEAEQLYRESLQIAEELGDKHTVAGMQHKLAHSLASRGEYEEAQPLFRSSLEIKEKLGARREIVVTQSALADLLRIQGQYDEAAQIYRKALATCEAIQDPHGVAVVLMGLGHLALVQEQCDEALLLLQQARQGFESLGLRQWIAQLDALLFNALDMLVAKVHSALQGDFRAGQQARDICLRLVQSSDATLSTLGQSLQRVLAGDPPKTALADLPDNLRIRILEGLKDQE
jgi:tetratricopeptide (TPR) repeat protein